MATYIKKAGTNLNATLNVSYGGQELSKTLIKNYNDFSVVKKTVTGADLPLAVVLFSKGASLAGTFLDCKFVLICNEGAVSSEITLTMPAWTGGTPDTSGDPLQRVHFILNPNEYVIYPNIAYIHYGTSVNAAGNGDDTALDNAVPNSALFVDSGVNLDAKLEDDATSLGVADIAPFEVGDLVQVGINASTTTRIEVMEVTAITIDDAGTDQDGAGALVVTRGLFGTSLADGDSQTDASNGAVSGANIHLPFFNEYYDHDRALSGSSQLVQTDNKGRWKSRNFFGQGRSLVGFKEGQGLVQGSVAIKFYNSASQEISFGGTTSNIEITSTTDSKLTASTAYAFDLTIDDSSAVTVAFTTDSSNTNFGGANGVINKIQTQINTLTRTTGGGLYGYGCTVAISKGNLKFTSHSHLAPHDGTNGSKILLADASSGTNLLSGSAGIFPDDAVLNAPIASALPDDKVIDTTTGVSYTNLDAFMYDDGNGNLIYQGTMVGSVVYMTGAIQWVIPSLSNAQFVINAHYASAVSGGLKLGANVDDNGINGIYARSMNEKIDTTIGVYVFS